MLFFSTYCLSQAINGTVATEDGPIPGVNIINLNTGDGTMTDFDGNFILENLSMGDEIEFSFIGFKTEKIIFDGQTDVNISLVLTSENLDEVILTGYGSQTKRKLTSSVSKIEGDDLANTALPTIDAALQGRAAGVQITQGSALSGAATKIRIRGANSAVASSDPLFVVDGIVVESGGFLDNTGVGEFMVTGGGSNVLQSLNPNDIQSIEVLKDASATAIYGARGSSGVILITTKSGRSGKTQIDLTIDTGTSDLTRKLDMANTDEYLTLAQEAWYNDGNDPTKFWADSGILTNGLTRAEALQNNTDWQEVALRKGKSYRGNISASGGDEKTKFFISGSFLDENSIYEGNEYLKITTRTNLTHKLSDKFEIGTFMTYSYVDNSPVSNQNGLGRANSLLPIYPVYNEDGTYFDIQNNVLANIRLMDYNDKSRNFLSNWFINYDISENLNFRTEFGINSLDSVTETYRDALIDANGIARATSINTSRNSWNLKSQINYNKSFGKHNLDILAAVDVQKNRRIRSNVIGIGYSNSSQRTPIDAGQTDIGYSEQAYSFLSFLSRINYDFDGKYLLSFTIRRDGSSRFGVNNQYGTFPAASIGYNLSDEIFFKPLKEFINYFKIRASYGISGNAEIGNYLNESQYETVQYDGNVGLQLSNIADDKLSWETTTQTNLGLSFELLNGKIRGDLDYYDKVTDDLLLSLPVSSQVGLSGTSYTTNVGQITNEGLEISVGATIVDQNDFTWDAQLNFAKSRNEVTDIGGDADFITIEGFANTTIYKGYPIGITNIPVWHGVDPATGQDIYETPGGELLNRDEGIAQYGSLQNFFGAIQQLFGNPWPDFTGGFNSQINYKNWFLSTLFTFSVGQNFIASGQTVLSKYAFTSNNNFLRHMLGRWRNPGDITRVAQANRDPINYSRTSEFSSDVDYLRMRDLTIGYRFDLNSNTLRGLDVYLKLTNYLTFTNAQPWMYDPENIPSAGNTNIMDYWKQKPQAKSINVGVNFKF